ncbi:HAD family phosphatase [Yoonia sp. BS5-3]|uniref:phosphoglycolate phosphatase n=1 Tax=Yoonia phaeophyticola TaxID=3137369 RepID=A0ABZ2V7D5_9RHOB
MNPELVIFDCDGVLVDTENLTCRVISLNLNRHGFAITPEDTHTLFAGGTIASAGAEAVRRGASLPADWVDQMYTEIFDALRQGVDVIDGVTELIDLLAQNGVAMAIASNGPVAKMEITLRPSGLWDAFAGRIYSGHDHTPKPAPDMLLRIMEDAEVSAAQTVMIDDMPSGCQAARAAGITCFGYVADGDPARIDGTGAIPAPSMTAIINALKLR